MRVPQCQPFSYEMGKRNSNLHSSFVFRLPTLPENGIRDSIFVFRFPNTLKMEFQLVFSFSVFPLLWKTKLQLTYCHFCFFDFTFRKTLKTEFQHRFSFFVAVFLLLLYLPEQEECKLRLLRHLHGGRIILVPGSSFFSDGIILALGPNTTLHM